MSSVDRRSPGPQHGRQGLWLHPEQCEEKQKKNVPQVRHHKTCPQCHSVIAFDMFPFSTFHLNESSLDSSLGGTPPLVRRHSHGLRGSKLNSFCLGRDHFTCFFIFVDMTNMVRSSPVKTEEKTCLISLDRYRHHPSRMNPFNDKTSIFLADDVDKDEDTEKKKTRRFKTNSMVNVSNTIGACNYMTKTQEKKVPVTNNPGNISKQHKIKSFVGKNNFQHESQTPVIIINNHTTPGKVSADQLKENVIKALKSEKSRGEAGGRGERRRRGSCGDMDHIRAKWLLGFNLTMVRLRMRCVRRMKLTLL